MALLNNIRNFFKNGYKVGFLLFLPIAIYSCKQETRKSEFIGTYKIDKVVPVNPDSTFRMQQTSDWRILLKDKNNFHIYGTNINFIGFWDVKNNGTKEYSILFKVAV
ncbi:MAG TPA: hypothetical protein VF476_17045 [Chitinophagaceae bacterium]